VGSLVLTCDSLFEPLAIGSQQPSLGMALNGSSSEPASIEISVRDNVTEIWSTGPIPFDSSVMYAGQALVPGRRYTWTATVTFTDGSLVEGDSFWECSPTLHEPWSSLWIQPDPHSQPALNVPVDDDLDDTTRWLNPVVALSTSFDLTGSAHRGRLHITARGHYVAFINGARVGDHELAPGWTDYRVRTHFQTHDVTDLLVPGNNTIRVLLGDGWFAGLIGPDVRQRGAHYGWSPSLTALLVAETPDELVEITTDESWTWSSTALRYSDMLAGELCDEFQFADPTPRSVQVVPSDASIVVPDPGVPIRVVRELAALSVSPREPGRWIVDFGQNFAGRVRIDVSQLTRGERLRLRHAEVLQPNGELYTDNLRSAAATDTFVGDGVTQWYEPLFTYHGFRFVEVVAEFAHFDAEGIVGRALSSDTPSSGQVDTSDPMLGKLVSNIEWSQRSNFMSVPTDCPQRDERLGWGGDAQVFLATACWNSDLRAFLRKWATDIVDAQLPSGAFSDVAPKVYVHREGAPGYADAGVTAPWTLYRNYGDLQAVKDHLPSMKKWADWIVDGNPEGLWLNRVGHNYGDWLAPGVTAPHELVATASLARSLHRIRVMAEAVGEHGTASEIDDYLSHTVDAYREAFLADDGRVASETQTAYVLTLAAPIASASERPEIASHMSAALRRDGRLTTGFLGVADILPELTRAGFAHQAWDLILSREVPSWGYAIDRGATTIWERWDGIRADGTFQTRNMNSFNHFCLGSVGEWLYEFAAGITREPQSSGWRAVRIAPNPTDRIESLAARYLTPFGQIRSGWSNTSSGRTYDVTIPGGVEADFELPAGEVIRNVSSATQDAPGMLKSIEQTGHVRLQAGHTVVQSQHR